MDRMLAALSLVISFSRLALVAPDLIVTPRNTEALIGNSTFVNCSTSLISAEIHWFHYASGTNTDRSFVYGYGQFYPPYQGRYRLEKNEATGAYNLVISSVTLEDAGKYECQDDAGRGTKNSADLIVLEASPVCKSNVKPEGIIGPNSCGIEPEDLQLSCLVSYHGNQPPIILWKKVGSESTIDEGTFRNVSDKKVINYLKTKVNSGMDGWSYHCQTTRSATAQYGCTSETVHIIGSASYLVVIYIIFTVILIIAMVVSLTGGWYLHLLWVKRQESKRPQACSIQEQQKLVEVGNEAETENKSAEELELVKENERLTAKVHELEQRLYRTDKANYGNSPTLVYSIVPATTEKEKSPITGIAILDLKLFVVIENSPVIEVYDSQTFHAVRPLVMTELFDPQDIASSKANQCLYIIVNSTSKDSTIEVIRLDPTGQITKKWSIEGIAGRLSTYESNLIACVSDKRLVLEYSSDGDLINTVRLSPGKGFEKLWHAIKLTGTNFAISHKKVNENRPRVCIIDSNGDVLHAFEENLMLPDILRKINVPICLADDRGKFILVADSTNDKVLLMSSTLQFEKELFAPRGSPVRICLDEANGRIFVAENDATKNLIGGRIFVSENDETKKSKVIYGRISIFNVTQTRRS